MDKPALKRSADPVQHKIMEILPENGEWLDFEKLAELVSPCVAAGEAWRYAEQNRLQYFKRKGIPPQDRKYGNEANTIISGQRMIILRHIRTLRKSDRVEVEYIDPASSKPRLKSVRRKVEHGESEV